MQHILSILHKFGDRTNNQELDKNLICYLGSSSPIEKELARLILSGNLLSNFPNPELQDKVLDEIGKVINIDIIKPKRVHIGEEAQCQEFKTSLVFPPNNGGNEDLEQQSQNVLREILAMMNAKGGVLYIGVNDDGNVVGLYDDLHYFADSTATYNETKAKDNFKNHFSCLLAERLGAENASKFDYDFENREGYIIFKVEVPVLHMGRVNQRVQHYEIFLKKASVDVRKLSFSLGLALIFFLILAIFPSVTVLMSVPFGIYCRTSLFPFSMAPFCHAQ